MRGKLLSCDDHTQIFAQHILPLLQNKHYLIETFDLCDVSYCYYKTNILTTRCSV